MCGDNKVNSPAGAVPRNSTGSGGGGGSGKEKVRSCTLLRSRIAAVGNSAACAATTSSKVAGWKGMDG